MTESTTSAGQLRFKAPASDEWCALPVDDQDKDQQETTKTARDLLKCTERLRQALLAQSFAALNE